MVLVGANILANVIEVFALNGESSPVETETIPALLTEIVFTPPGLGSGSGIFVAFQFTF